MPAQKPDKLPESLAYLQPYADFLAKLAPANLHEDVNPTKLDRAILKSIRGMDPASAEEKVLADRDLLGKLAQRTGA